VKPPSSRLVSIAALLAAVLVSLSLAFLVTLFGG